MTKSMTNTLLSTHWDGCWKDHHECAIAKIESLQNGIDHLRTAIIHGGYDIEACVVCGKDMLRKLHRPPDHCHECENRC